MVLKLTRLLPNKKKTPVLVNWDNVQWAQTFLNEVSVSGLSQPAILLKHDIDAGTVVVMSNGPELYLEETLTVVERMLGMVG